MRKFATYLLIFAIIANAGIAGTSNLFTKNDINNSEFILGDKIIICTGWGIKYVDVSEVFGSDDTDLSNKMEQKERQPYSPFKKHCTLCINPALDPGNVAAKNLDFYLDSTLEEDVQFFFTEILQPIHSKYQQYLNPNSPPKLS